jgi:hypothetical protein
MGRGGGSIGTEGGVSGNMRKIYPPPRRPRRRGEDRRDETHQK